MRTPRYSHEGYRISKGGRRCNIWLWTPGIASEFINYLPDLPAQEGRIVVLYCRVSTEKQEKRGNLDEQTDDAIRRLRQMGFRPGRTLFIFDGVESSRIHDHRILLERALAFARERNGILVALSRDRFIRCSSFGRGVPKEVEPPRIAEYMQLRDLAGGVALATILHPDDPAVRSEQVKRGQRAKGRKGGRPPTPEQRKLLRAISEVWRSLPCDRGERVSGRRPKPRAV